jgi:hypothetical protein
MCATGWKQWIYRGAFLGLLGPALLGIAHGAEVGQVGWWTLDESSGTIAHDSSGNGNDGTLAGAVTWVAGKLDGALDFPGASSAFVSVPDSASLDIADAITMAVWVNPRTTGDHRWLVAKQMYGAAETYGLSFTDAGTVECGVSINNAWTYRQTTAALSNGTWAHVVGQYSPPFMRVFINGKLSQEWNVGTSKINTNNNNLLIGKGSHGQPFAGSADDLRIYNRALTVEEIQQAMLGRRPGPATSPAPAKGATDVPREVTLSWQAGPYAATHDVYLGTTFADVNTAGTATPGVLASGGQAATTFTPGRLELGQTYYWRVDEVNKAPDKTVFKGDVWSFTVEPVAYPLKKIVATTNGTSDKGAGPENTVNGSGLSADDRHSTQSGDMWLAAPTAGAPIWLQYEFDRVYKLHELLVWNYNTEFEAFLGFGLKNVTVQYSSDGVNWTPFGAVTFAQGTGQTDYAANTTVDFKGAAAAQYVRLNVNSAWGAGAKYGLSEVRFSYVPVQAREPQPADRAANVAVDTSLGWRAGRDTATNKVYFGKDPNALAPVKTISEAGFAPGALDLDATYYWRVDEVNEAQAVPVWQGDVWTFATAKYVIVDDFESYTDADGNRIYQIWKDGEANKTGAVVGHAQSPFAEQTTVHSGKQSLPLSYQNTGVTTAEAQYALSQNWTTSGIKSLSLYFYGDPNSSGQLYLKINNTKVPYNGPATNIKKAEWQVWNVDLSTVAGDLSKVTMLTIGIEGTGASGILYLDDIRLYPRSPVYLTPVQPDKAGLVAYYAFDGNVKDSSGKGNDGTVVREPKWVTGKVGQAMDFDGMRDFVEVPDSASLDIADAITMAAWVNPRSTNDHRWLIAKSAWGAAETYGLGITNAGAIECGVSINNAWTYRQTTQTISDGTWSHIVGQYSPPFIRVFINGKLSQEWNVGTSKINTNSHNLLIGKQTGNQFYGGSADDLRLYNRALSPEEILGLAGETAPVAKPFD